MNKMVEEYINSKRKEEREKYLKDKNETLIKLGIYEKVYSPINMLSEEYPWIEWDDEKEDELYYKKVAADVSDEEYEEILRLNKEIKQKQQSQQNPIAMTLMVIAVITYIAGFIAGIALGWDGYDFNIMIAFIYWCVAFISGTMLLGFAEIIKLLNDIKNK